MDDGEDNPWVNMPLSSALFEDMATTPIQGEESSQIQDTATAPKRLRDDLGPVYLSPDEQPGHEPRPVKRPRRRQPASHIQPAIEEETSYEEDAGYEEEVSYEPEAPRSDSSVTDLSWDLAHDSVLLMPPDEDALCCLNANADDSQQQRVTNEQIKRQLKYLVRDAQELRRLLVRGTGEWWAGTSGTAPRKRLDALTARVRTQLRDLRRRGEPGASEHVLSLAWASMEGAERAAGRWLEDPAGHVCDALLAVRGQTASAVSGFRSLMGGELGSQSIPFRHRAQDGIEPDNEMVLVKEEFEFELAELLRDDEGWEVLSEGITL